MSSRAEPALGIAQCPSEDLLDRIARQRLQHEDLGAREQRGVDLERRVLGRGADEHDVASLHARKEGILLCLVEAVDLVDEDDRAAAGAASSILRRRHDFLDLFDSGQHRAERDEVRLCQLGDDTGKRCLARAGRSPKDDRLKQIALDGFAKRLAGTEDLVLADDVVERLWTYALGQWRSGSCRPRRAQFTRGPLVVFVSKQ